MKTKKPQRSRLRKPTIASRAMDVFFALFGRSPKELAALLEEDARLQAERMQQLEQAILLPLLQPEPVLVPVAEDDEPVIERPRPVSQESGSVDLRPEVAATVEPAVVQTPEPVAVTVESDDQPTPTSSGGRTNYQSMMAASRIRRRII
jgi:hypothetical protein